MIDLQPKCPDHSRYLAGCPCCRAYRASHKVYRDHEIARGTWQRRVDVTGASRRLQALARAGYGSGWIAHQLTTDRSMVVSWREPTCRTVQPVTHQLVSYLYTRLWDSDGPSTLARQYAARRNWHPYEAWDDNTIDDPAATPYQQAIDWTDWVLLDKVKRRQARFVDLSPTDQRELFLWHLQQGGSARGFRDRYRPVPIHILRELMKLQGTLTEARSA